MVFVTQLIRMMTEMVGLTLDEASCGTDSLNSSSIPTDTDGDGTCDTLDSDDDGDSWSDSDEASCGTDSLN